MKHKSFMLKACCMAAFAVTAAHAQVDSTGVAPLRGSVYLAPAATPPSAMSGAPWTKQFAGQSFYIYVADGPNSAWWGFPRSQKICGHTGYTNPGGGWVGRTGRRTVEVYIHSDGAAEAWTLDQYSGARREAFGRTYIPNGRDHVSLAAFNGSRGSLNISLFPEIDAWDRTKVTALNCYYVPPPPSGGCSWC